MSPAGQHSAGGDGERGGSNFPMSSGPQAGGMVKAREAGSWGGPRLRLEHPGWKLAPGTGWVCCCPRDPTPFSSLSTTLQRVFSFSFAGLLASGTMGWEPLPLPPPLLVCIPGQWSGHAGQAIPGANGCVRGQPRGAPSTAWGKAGDSCPNTALLLWRARCFLSPGETRTLPTQS